MDVLGSILKSMDAPPRIDNSEIIRQKKAKAALMEQRQKEKERLSTFRAKVEKKINSFFQDATQTKLKFEPMEKIYRTIIHEIVEDAGLCAYSFGEEGIDRHIIVWKKEFIPSEDELNALRDGQEWSEEKAKELEQKRKQAEDDEKNSKTVNEKFVPNSNYKEKYQHLIGLDSAKDAAKKTGLNKQYGFVPSENKKDSRSIEQTLADIQSKKRLKRSLNDA